MSAIDTTQPAPAVNGPGQYIPYRTAFEVHLDLPEAANRVREQLRVWLRDKQYDVNRFDAGVPGIGPRAVLFYAATNVASGWQLRERPADGGITWVSTVGVSRTGDRPPTWISLQVEPIAEDDGPLPAASPPRLVRLLLDVLDAYDGDAVLRGNAIRVCAGEVDDLLELVCAERRRLPMIVAAAPPDQPFADWRDTVDRLTAELCGLASVYVLDPVAVPVFNDGIGPTHGIESGALRTYLTRVDPAVTDDAIRHRLLSPRRIEQGQCRAGRALVAPLRQLAANSLPPAALRGLELSLGDFTRAAVRPPRQRVSPLVEEVALLTGLLETADHGERHLKATISRLQDELLDLTAELEAARNELELRDDMVHHLRRTLVKLGQGGQAYQPVPRPSPLPTSFAEVLDRLPELAPEIRFTGDPSAALDLDEHPQHPNWAQLAWQASLALADYVRAKREQGFAGDFKRWCESPAPGGRVVSVGKVALDESQTVRANRRFAQTRTLPVPVEVDPRGSIFMGAHIRLGSFSTVAPRMHFHDGSIGQRMIYIGYLGRHLPNTLT